MIKYKQIKHIIHLDVDDEYEIKGIVNHHTLMQSQYIFILRKGNNYNPSKHIDELISKGIVLHQDTQLQQGYYVDDLIKVCHELLNIYYKDICSTLTLIGVCGTNGKSSVVHFLGECLGKQAMRIGTGSVMYLDKVMKQENTTPDEISLLHYLDIARIQMLTYVLMEVSSQGIDQHRIDKLLFDYIVYTNISSDHLDYHKTLIHYRYSKYKLLKFMKQQGIVIAQSDALYYRELRHLCQHTLITYGVCSSHFKLSNVSLHAICSTFNINGYTCKVHVLGRENIYNLCACISVLRCLDISYECIINKIATIQSLAGRMQLVVNKHCYIYVDYAHTSYAFYSSMKFFNQIKQARLIVVVGCGGDREKQKRKEIGYYASVLSDICIFSEDNSRSEETKEIIKDMCERVEKEVIIIENREEAIQYAIHQAQKNDIILISGKGNEDIIVRQHQKISYKDEDVIVKLME